MSKRNKENELSLPAIPVAVLIPLKAKAWLDLTARKEKGEQVDEKNTRKHRNDVFRLMGTLAEDMRIDLPKNIAEDMAKFFYLMQELSWDEEKNIGKSIEVKSFNLKIAVDRLRAIFRFGLE